MRATAILHGLAAAAVAVAAACGTPAPRAIAFGQDECDHCHMTIADRRTAAALVTRTGKTYVFDDIGCLARFVASGGVRAADVAGYWVHDFLAPDSVLPVAAARFVRADRLHTPMGSGLAATRAGDLERLRALLGGTRLDWPQVLASGEAAR